MTIGIGALKIWFDVITSNLVKHCGKRNLIWIQLPLSPFMFVIPICLMNNLIPARFMFKCIDGIPIVCLFCPNRGKVKHRFGLPIYRKGIFFETFNEALILLNSPSIAPSCVEVSACPLSCPSPSVWRAGASRTIHLVCTKGHMAFQLTRQIWSRLWSTKERWRLPSGNRRQWEVPLQGGHGQDHSPLVPSTTIDYSEQTGDVDTGSRTWPHLDTQSDQRGDLMCSSQPLGRTMSTSSRRSALAMQNPYGHRAIPEDGAARIDSTTSEGNSTMSVYNHNDNGYMKAPEEPWEFVDGTPMAGSPLEEVFQEIHLAEQLAQEALTRAAVLRQSYGMGPKAQPKAKEPPMKKWSIRGCCNIIVGLWARHTEWAFWRVLMSTIVLSLMCTA